MNVIYLFPDIYMLCVCVCIHALRLSYIYYACPDLLRFEHSEFLEPAFFFHINAFRDEVNP